jgi:nifR3 family TIM-barrel protein
MLLAPLEGVGHPVWRQLIAEQGGLGLSCMGFVPVGTVPIHPPSIRKHVVRASGLPLSVQLLGREPERMAEAAAVLAEAGVDVVDVNLGCPARRAVARGAGAALLRDPDAMYHLLSRVRAAVPGRLSAKIRAGFDNTEAIFRVGDAAAAAGIDFLVVHPRSRADQFQGVADWRLIRALTEHLSIPVVGNGDCWYADDALRMERETGCAAVMVGRPAIRNPWIFSQVAALRRGQTPARPDGAQVAAWLHRAVTRYREVFGHGKLHTGKIKELLRYLGRAVDDGGRFQQAALRAPHTDDILHLADAHLLPLPAQRLDLAATSQLGFERSGGISMDD